MLGSESLSRLQPTSGLPHSLQVGKNRQEPFNHEMGPLQRQLHQGEFNLLRHARMLESNFVQVNRRGEAVDIHNEFEIVTMAIACTNLKSDQSANVLLVARSVLPSRENLLCQSSPRQTYELTRLLPLHFLRLSIHSEIKKQLRIKLPTGRAFYVELCPHPSQEDQFKLWVRVIYSLQPPSEQSSEILNDTRDPGGQGEAQRPQSSIPATPADTVSIHTVLSLCRGTSPREEDSRSKRSLSPSVRSLHCTEETTFLPSICQENTSERGSVPLVDNEVSEESLDRPLMDDAMPEESFERLPSQKDLVPEEQSKPKSNPPPNRSSTRSGSKSRRKGSSRKPSKIVSLIRSCSWGSQRSSRRDSKGRAQKKKHK